jgi:hypothetical protein
MPHAFHARFVHGYGPCISRGPRRQPFASAHKDKTTPTLGRSLGDPRQTGPAIVLGHLIPPPHDSPGVGERGFS